VNQNFGLQFSPKTVSVSFQKKSKFDLFVLK